MTKMALSSMLTITTILLAAAMTAPAEGAAKSAPPPVDCSSVILNLADCLSFVQNGSNVEKPQGKCCPGLKEILKTAPNCLCVGFQQSASFGVVLNMTKALDLPHQCGVHAPSVSKCALAVSPAGAPGGAMVSPVGAPSSAIAGAPSGIGAGETSPSAAPSTTSSSSAISVSVQLVVAGIAAVFFSSF